MHDIKHTYNANNFLLQTTVTEKSKIKKETNLQSNGKQMKII